MLAAIWCPIIRPSQASPFIAQLNTSEHCTHVCGTLQSIQIETSTGQVQTALLLLCEMDDALAAHQRGAAMHDHNPFHSFMFDSQGHLLFANKAAARACRIDPAPSGESSNKPGR